jgi:hypothetical protein
VRVITWMQRRGLCGRQCEAGFGPKTGNRAFVARFRACGMKQWCGAITGGSGWHGGGGGGCAFTNERPGGGIWAKNPNPSRRGSVSGVPCKTAVGGGAGRCLVRENGTEMAGGLRVRQREARGRVLGQNPKTERLWLGYGRAV